MLKNKLEEMLNFNQIVTILLNVLILFIGLHYSISVNACIGSVGPYNVFGFQTGHYVGDAVAQGYFYERHRYPSNIKGAVYHERGSSRHINPKELTLSNLGAKIYPQLISALPPPLTANQFSIVDQTTGKKLTPKLVRLNAPDTYIDLERFNFTNKHHYYIFRGAVSEACLELSSKCEHPVDYHYLRNNGYLEEVTQVLKKTEGYFRVEPQEGLIPGHTYHFKFHEEKGKRSYGAVETTIDISQTPLDLTAFEDIEPIEYVGFTKAKDQRFINKIYDDKPDSLIYDWYVSYYIPKALRKYQNKLRFVPLKRFVGEKLFSLPNLKMLDGCETVSDRSIKLFTPLKPAYSSDYDSCHESKANFAFLEIEDKFYDSKTSVTCEVFYE